MWCVPLKNQSEVLYAQINVLCMTILLTDSLVAQITLYIINIFLKSHFCVNKEKCDLNDLDDLGNGITLLTSVNFLVWRTFSNNYFLKLYSQKRSTKIHKMANLLTSEPYKVKKSEIIEKWYW